MSAHLQSQPFLAPENNTMENHMKQETSAQVYSVDQPQNQYMQAPQTNQPWRNGTFQHVPYKGLAALLIAVGGVIASIAILITSNNDPVADWAVQPTVYLAIASTITNILLTYSLRKALDVAWWKKATSDHTNLGDLHRQWEFGTSVIKALLAGRHFNMIAVACILAALAPVNGPLLQRASTVTQGLSEKVVDVKLQIAETLPDGYTGFLSGRGHSVSLLTPNFTRVVNSANQGTPINFTSTGCKGDCSTKIRGAGFAVNCSTSTQPFSLEPSSSADGDFNPDQQSVTNGTRAFGTSILWDYATPGQIQLGVQFKDKADCAGDLQIRNCTLQASIVEYPVLINGNDSTISLDPSSSMFDDKVISKTDYAVNSMTGPTTLGGLSKAFKDNYESTANLRFVGAVGYELITTGGVANQYAILPDNSPSANCSLSFADPSNDLLATMRDLMFRTAVAAANATTKQSVTATDMHNQPIFESHYLFLGLATAFSALAIIAIFPNFLGWTAVGRKATMSPVETAKAFRAPMLMGTDPNAEVKNIVKSVGDRPVKYGAVTTSESAADWLGMNQPNLVRRPQAGERFVG